MATPVRKPDPLLLSPNTGGELLPTPPDSRATDVTPVNLPSSPSTSNSASHDAPTPSDNSAGRYVEHFSVLLAELHQKISPSELLALFQSLRSSPPPIKELLSFCPAFDVHGVTLSSAPEQTQVAFAFVKEITSLVFALLTDSFTTEGVAITRRLFQELVRAAFVSQFKKRPAWFDPLTVVEVGTLPAWTDRIRHVISTYSTMSLQHSSHASSPTPPTDDGSCSSTITGVPSSVPAIVVESAPPSASPTSDSFFTAPSSPPPSSPLRSTDSTAPRPPTADETPELVTVEQVWPVEAHAFLTSMDKEHPQLFDQLNQCASVELLLAAVGSDTLTWLKPKECGILAFGTSTFDSEELCYDLSEEAGVPVILLPPACAAEFGITFEQRRPTGLRRHVTRALEFLTRMVRRLRRHAVEEFDELAPGLGLDGLPKGQRFSPEEPLLRLRGGAGSPAPSASVSSYHQASAREKPDQERSSTQPKSPRVTCAKVSVFDGAAGEDVADATLQITLSDVSPIEAGHSGHEVSLELGITAAESYHFHRSYVKFAWSKSVNSVKRLNDLSLRVPQLEHETTKQGWSADANSVNKGHEPDGFSSRSVGVAPAFGPQGNSPRMKGADWFINFKMIVYAPGFRPRTNGVETDPTVSITHQVRVIRHAELGTTDAHKPDIWVEHRTPAVP
ncbi:hypothetical protein MNV49_003357, partial [Pseudohyphozyma bogoriensis]